MTHTPGQWTAWQHDEDEWSVYSTAKTGKELLHDICRRANQEDAHLIAAAPDLLQACQKVVSTYEKLNNSDICDWRFILGELGDLAGGCEMAIRKANPTPPVYAREALRRAGRCQHSQATPTSEPFSRNPLDEPDPDRENPRRGGTT